MKITIIASSLILATALAGSVSITVHAHSLEICDADEYDLCMEITGHQDPAACAEAAILRCTNHGHGGSTGDDPSASDSFNTSGSGGDPVARPKPQQPNTQRRMSVPMRP